MVLDGCDMAKVTLVPSQDECTLDECPPGLFLFDGTLGLKDEYGTHEGRLDVYCADSGEYFWGGTSTLDELRKLVVQPMTVLRPEAPRPFTPADIPF
jgi:hypothetical protein